MKALTGKESMGNAKSAVEGMRQLISLLKANDCFKERRPVLATHNTLKSTMFSAALFQGISAGKSSEGVLQVVKGIEKVMEGVEEASKRLDASILGWSKKAEDHKDAIETARSAQLATKQNGFMPILIPADAADIFRKLTGHERIYVLEGLSSG